ncbi:MAG: chemotaxis protein CheR [Deltaproteobacteria bacterium]|nr:chemotaxis protein CheR [Deltaproteobacteria bacterium]
MMADERATALAEDGTEQSAREHKEGRSFFVVGIGASAGGLEALREFFEHTRPADAAAFVVVQHLSPDYKSLMPELLARHTVMPVVHIEDGVALIPGHVYLLPPKNNLTIFHGRLFLAPQETPFNLPIDIFFCSLAEDQQERAVGIVLSGTGSDGTRGVRAIKEHGGMVMVQDEASAGFDGMPKNAIATGIVDFIMPPKDMPAALEQYISGNQRIYESRRDRPERPAESLAKILALVKVKTGMDFSFYKENTILRRIERRMGIIQSETMDEYARHLEGHPEEISILYREVLIGVTRFFRDPDAYELIKTSVLPEIFNAKNSNESIRVWSAGCSTGEEAYSLAILFHEFCEEHGFLNEIKIFATDIDREALSTASTGIYPLSIVADASMRRLGRFFYKKGDSYQVQPQIRKKVIFAYHNIVKNPPFPKIDLISCRNMLIYLQPVLQKQILSNFLFSLTPGGHLFLGSSESVGEYGSFFTPLGHKLKIFRYRGGQSNPGASRRFVVDPRSVEKTNRLPEPIIAASKSRPFSDDLDDAYEQATEIGMQPAVLLNGERRVVHVFGDVDRYLKLASGRINLDVSKLVRGGVGTMLASTLHKAAKEQVPARIENIVVSDDSPDDTVSFAVFPIRTRSGEQYFVVRFEPGRVDSKPGVGKLKLDEAVRVRIEDLERDLQYTRENLQATIEELETSNEELQATNEELLASNEELQSTNEELQSVNEELLTVNSEYQLKIQELTLLNDDMENLMSTASSGTVFLDDEFRIRKFTAPVGRYFSIIRSDVGRPLTHLSHRLKDLDLDALLRRVVSIRKEEQLEVRCADGSWVLIGVYPYVSSLNADKGVVVTLTDITRIMEAEEAFKREHELLLRVFGNSPVATTMVDAKGEIVFANEAARVLLDLERDEAGRFRFDDKRFSICDDEGRPISTEDLPFSIIFREKRSVEYRHWISDRDGHGICLDIVGNPMFGPNQDIEGAVFKIETCSDGWKRNRGAANPR